MTTGSSIAMQLTARGTSAIATIRIQGALVESFLSTHFRRVPARGTMTHGELRDGNRVLDDPVVVLESNGGWADLHLHGGDYLTRAVMQLMTRFGFVEVDCQHYPLPPEACDGKDALENEVLRYLPRAMTLEATHALVSQSHLWRDGVLRDLPELMRDESLYWLLNTPHVAIVGEANVGKSTIANQLFAQERSIVADMPGTTRDWVGEYANLDGLRVLLVDTPGIRATTDSAEQEAIESSASVVDRADAIVWVIDACDPHEPDYSRARVSPERQIVALNKWDRRRKAAERLRETLVARFDDARVISSVATAGEGMDRLRRGIRSLFGCADLCVPAARWWTLAQRERLAMLARRGDFEREQLIAALVDGQFQE